MFFLRVQDQAAMQTFHNKIELNKILVRIFIKQWESIKWDKEKTGRSMFQGWGDSFTKLWKLHLSKNTQSKPSNNNKIKK